MPDPTQDAAFASRLQRYGLTPQDIRANSLRVIKDSVIYLGATGNKQSCHAPRLLRCKDIDDLKRWVGVPDSFFTQNPQSQARRSASTLPPTSLIDRSKTVTAQLQAESNPRKAKELKDGLYKDLREHRGT